MPRPKSRQELQQRDGGIAQATRQVLDALLLRIARGERCKILFAE
jgi:hypothetical protein